MKNSSLSTLCLALLLTMAQAIQPNQGSIDSWHAPFCNKTFLYPLVAIGGGYALYALFHSLYPSDDLNVSAPWHDDKKSKTYPTEESDGLESSGVISPEKLQEIIEVEIDLFCQTQGPQLIATHALLADQNLDEEMRKDVEYKLAMLEESSPPFAQSIPMLMVCQVGLQSAKLEILEQLENQKIVRSAFDQEYLPLLQVIDALTLSIQDFIDLYASACPNEIRALTTQLSGEVS